MTLQTFCTLGEGDSALPASASLITLLLPAYLRHLLLCTHTWVFVHVTECFSFPFLLLRWQRSPTDLWTSARVISHTKCVAPTALCVQVLDARWAAISLWILDWALTQFPALHSIHKLCQWPNAQLPCLHQDQDTGALTLNLQQKQLISNSFISQKYCDRICYSKR